MHGYRVQDDQQGNRHVSKIAVVRHSWALCLHRQFCLHVGLLTWRQICAWSQNVIEVKWWKCLSEIKLPTNGWQLQFCLQVGHPVGHPLLCTHAPVGHQLSDQQGDRQAFFFCLSVTLSIPSWQKMMKMPSCQPLVYLQWRQIHNAFIVQLIKFHLFIWHFSYHNTLYCLHLKSCHTNSEIFHFQRHIGGVLALTADTKGLCYQIYVRNYKLWEKFKFKK